MSNPNDLVIVRRGDVEALKQEAMFGVFRRDAVEFDKLNALLSNAPVLSGEPYGYIDTAGNLVKDTNINSMLAKGEELIPYYLNPQSPISHNEQQPSVDDVLAIVDRYIKSAFNTTARNMAIEIREAIAQEVKSL